MKKYFLALSAACLLLAAPVKGQSQAEPYIDMNTTVEREVTPDEIYLKITINENDYKGKKSLEEMQNAMIGALKANRIDIPECLTLNYMGSDISYKLFSKSIKPKTEATYTLKLYDVAIMQQVIASLEERQISNIELIKTRYTKGGGVQEFYGSRGHAAGTDRSQSARRSHRTGRRQGSQHQFVVPEHPAENLQSGTFTGSRQCRNGRRGLFSPRIRYRQANLPFQRKRKVRIEITGKNKCIVCGVFSENTAYCV